MIVDISQLTLQQKWGLAHATRLANEPIVSANAVEGAVQVPLKTVQEYADQQIQNICNSYWQSCQQYGLTEQVVPMLMSLDFAEQVALRTEYNIPDVIPAEYLAQIQ